MPCLPLTDLEDLDLPHWRRCRPGVAIGCGVATCHTCYEDAPNYEPDTDDGRDMTPPYEP